MAAVEKSRSDLLQKSLYKIELYIIKIIPYILALFYLLNTTLSYFYIDAPLISYIAGVSLLPLVHEIKHVQSHICMYYNVEEDSEEAAYLTGFIAQKMHRCFRHFIYTGVK